MRLTILFLIVAVTVGCLMMGCKPKPEEPAVTSPVKTGPPPGMKKAPDLKKEAGPAIEEKKEGDEPADEDAKLGDEPGDEDEKTADEPADDEAKPDDEKKAPDAGPADVKAPPGAKKTGP